MNEIIAKLYDQALVLESNGDYVAGELDPVKFAKLVAQHEREWVGLTEEDLKLLSAEWRIVYGAWMDDFAKDIEAKLRSKNT